MIHNQEFPEQYDAQSGNMIVYKPPEMSSLQQVKKIISGLYHVVNLQRRRIVYQNNFGSHINISCSVSGVFPLPDLRILIGSVPIRQDARYLGNHIMPSSLCLQIVFSQRIQVD